MSEQEATIFGGKITPHSLEKEITQSYIDYALSVIVSRALPDTRDGFKPVLRRILYAMYDQKIMHSGKHKKSARIVGEVLGKYHPHGDSSVYEAMVRMAQPWSMRYPLVDGQGNFWSIDGDSPAAMRYTEAKLTKIAEEMLADIEQDTVDWRDNFDASLQEPVMLPTKFPNHLCNGTMGIAVGMATNMAPHNLNEVIDASLLLIEKEGKKVELNDTEIVKEEDKTILVDAIGVLFEEDEKGNLTINKTLAEYLQNTKAKKIIVTNEEKEKIERECEEYNFEVFSLNNEPSKRKKEYFHTLLEEYNLDPSTVVYFDRTQKHLDVALDAKIASTLLYKGQQAGLENFINEFLQSQVTADGKYAVSIEEIMQIIKGPDFATGGIMYDSANILEVYKKGRGGIVTRGKTHIEEVKSHQVIVIDEIPYMVNKGNLVAKIGELVVTKKLEGVTDIRDESSKWEIRIVISLKRDIDADTILMQLFKHTDLQTNFNLNNVSLVDKGIQPRTLNIKDLLMEFVTFRRKVVYRRSVFQLNKAKSRLHILEGLKKAIDIIDEVIETIKQSQTKQDAKNQLMEKFDFSEEQAEYILMMRLQSLVGLEIQKISEEIEEKRRLIEYLEGIINDSDKLDAVVVEELEYIKNKFGDKRRTELSQDTSVYNLSGSLKALKNAADMVKEDVILWLSNDYKMKVLYQSRIQNIPDETLDIVYTQNQDKLIIITDKGELVVQRLKDFWTFTTAKAPLDIKDHFGLKGKIIFAKTLHFDYEYLLFMTNKNSIKKIKKEVILSFKKFPTVVMKLEKGERMVKALAVNDEDKVGVISKEGIGLLFSTQDVRAMGKTAGGIKAIALEEKDEVSNMFLYQDEPFILVYSDKEGKLLSVEDDLRIWKRARKWDVWATGNAKLKGALSIEEGAVRLMFEDGTWKTLHSNDIKLDMPDTALKKMVDKKIEMAYKPREEKEENLSYKEEIKKKKKAEAEKWSLFSEE